jgi:hypothetical protein
MIDDEQQWCVERHTVCVTDVDVSVKPVQGDAGDEAQSGVED